MILNRIFGHGKTFNIGYIVGEVLLIFVGITLSFYFEEWRTQRQNRLKEKEILREIFSSVKRDTVRMRNLTQLNEMASKKMAYLLDSTRQEKVLSKKSIDHFGFLNYFITFSPDWSAYNNIKSQGLDIISNTELRFMMIRYYEQMDDLSNWTNNITDIHFKASVLPYVIDEFSIYVQGERAIPEDFESLKKNKRFWKIVQRTKMFDDLTSARLKQRKTSGINFLDALEKELSK